MKLSPISDREAVMKFLYGDSAVYKAEPKKQKLSNTDKGLVAANAASAAFGAATMPALYKDAKSKVQSARNGYVPPKQIDSKPAKGFKLTRVGRAASKAGKALSNPKFAIPAAIGVVGGQAFNVAADAASTKSIADKSKVKKNLVLVSKADNKVSPLQILRANDKPHVPAGRKMKLVALDKVEGKVRQQAPKVAASAKAGAEAAANTWKVEAKVSKAVEDKRQVFGWASITEMDGQPVVDLQGDYVTIEEIEKAAHAYISKSRKGGDMHRRNGADAHHVSDLIESVVITPEKKEALGMPADSPTGWWVGFQVHDDDTWNLVKDGKRPMFSIHGSGKRIDKEMA